MLARIVDPEQRELQRQQMIMQKQALINSVLTSMARSRHEIVNAATQNLRA
jgi:DNA-binding TFAR19-related protein (PDSD5 family)